MFSLEEVFQAYYDCRKNKRAAASTIEFEENLEQNLVDLYYQLNDQTYEIGRSICFVVTQPKPREIWAAQFRDRVVHHVMYNRIFDRFHKRFIHDSYSCIPNKGVIYGAQRVHKFMRQATQGYQHPANYLQADLANFFVSINKYVLEDLLLRYIYEEELRWITRKILWHDPTTDVYVKGDKYKLSLIPPHKSLFNAPYYKGLPIGNLSSQYFANVYLNELDQYIKRNLKVSYYGRYVDDLVLISNIGTLYEEYEYLCKYAEQNLDLRFNPKKLRTNSVYKGIDFCGYILKPYRSYVRNRTKQSFKRVLYGNKDDNEHKINRVQSYLGFICHANVFNLASNHDIIDSISNKQLQGSI